MRLNTCLLKKHSTGNHTPQQNVGKGMHLCYSLNARHLRNATEVVHEWLHDILTLSYPATFILFWIKTWHTCIVIFFVLVFFFHFPRNYFRRKHNNKCNNKHKINTEQISCQTRMLRLRLLRSLKCKQFATDFLEWINEIRSGLWEPQPFYSLSVASVW